MPPVLGQKSPALVAFRFGVVYLTLFGLATQISGSLIPNRWFTYRGLGRLSPMREITHWVGRTVFSIDVPLDDVSGGETLFFWIQWFWVLAAAVAITLAWTLLARRGHGTSLARRSSDRAKAACRLAVRIVLAASLIEYGMTKVFLTQFPVPSLTALVTPVGEMTLSALLWTTIGSAPAYQITTGLVEALAGVLLLLPWTVTLGALLGVVSLLQVLLLNLTFDIGVKLVTTHLIVMALILLAPVARPLTSLLIRRASRVTGEPAHLDMTAGAWLVLPIVFGVYLLGVQAWMNSRFQEVNGSGRQKSILYGIWNLASMSVDGQARPAELNDYDRRWLRVVFDEPDVLVVQRTDDSFARYGASIKQDEAIGVEGQRSGTITLTKGASRSWRSRLNFERPSASRLWIEGEIDGQHVNAYFRLVDPSTLPLRNSGFRWIRPHDP